MSQLTLAWAVNQSRRVFKAKKKQVHPEDVSSAGTDGGGSPYVHGSPMGAKSRGTMRNQTPPRGSTGCLGALMALMGFGRGGSKVKAAAKQHMRQRRAGDPNNRPPGSPGFGPVPTSSPGSSRGSSRGSSIGRGVGSRNSMRSPVSKTPMPRPEMSTPSPSRPTGPDGRAGTRGSTAEHLDGSMGYRDSDDFLPGHSTDVTPVRRSRLGPSAPPPSRASGFTIDEELLMDDDATPQMNSPPGRSTSMGNTSWTGG